MLRLLADENFNQHIVRGVLTRLPQADIVLVQEAFLSGRDDEDVLDWAAKNARAVLTHDVTTMKDFAYARVAAGLAMPGVFEVHPDKPISEVIESIVLLLECSQDEEWANRIVFLPFR